MRLVTLIAATALLAACQGQKEEIKIASGPGTIETIPAEAPPEIPSDDPDAELKAVDSVYDEEWVVGYGWPGEYPDGFSVTGNNVIITGRKSPIKSETPSVECPLEKGATYQQWNLVRANADDLAFISATKSVPLTVTEDADIEVESEDVENAAPLVNIPVRKGDVVRVERYFGEGFGQIGINGKSYVADLQQLNAYTDADDHGPLDVDQWVMVTCADKGAHRAWLLLDDMLETTGISRFEITGYGEAADLE